MKLILVQLLNRLFNIRPHEWPRFLLLYLLSMTYVIGIIWATIILNAAFLENVGVDMLPWFLLIKVLLAIPSVTLYTAVANRIENDKLFIIIFLLGAVGFILGLILLNSPFNAQTLAYFFLYLLVFVPLGDIQAIHWYTYVNGFYDTRTIKRIIPVLVTAFGLASIIAGSTIDTLNAHLHFNGILVACLLLFVLSAGLIWVIPHILKEAAEVPAFAIPTESPEQEEQHLAYIDNIREQFHIVSNSPFLRSLAWVGFVLMLLFTFMDYLINETLHANLQTTENISNFLGDIVTVANLIILPIQIFLLNRIVGHIGLGNANLIFPTGNLIAAVALWFSPAALWAAFIGQFNRAYFYASIGYPLNNLLYNAVPLREKARARAFIGGLLIPMGAFLGSVILVIVQQLPKETLLMLLRLFVVALGILFFVAVLVIRRHYTIALLDMLEQEDYSFLLFQETSELTAVDTTALRSLEKKLEDSPGPEFTIFMARLISDIGGNASAPILVKVARESDVQIRAKILDILVAAELKAESVDKLYIDCVTDPDPTVRQAAIAGLKQTEGAASPTFMKLATTLLLEDNIETKAAVLPALLRAENSVYRATAIDSLQEILNSPIPYYKAIGMQILCQVGDPYAIEQLTDYMHVAEDEVRLEAILAIEMLANHKKIPASHIPMIIVKIKAWPQDPIERVRQAALVIMAHLDMDNAKQVMVQGLTDPSIQVRQTAVKMLISSGRKAIATLQPQLKSSNLRLQKMTAMILGQIDQRDYGSFVFQYVKDDLKKVFQNYVYLHSFSSLTMHPTVVILCSKLRETSQALLDEIFYFIAPIEESSSARLIQESLASDSERSRANAHEALESLTNPQIARLIGTLLNPERGINDMLRAYKATWHLQAPSIAQALQEILTNQENDPWLRSIATYVLGEVGQALMVDVRNASAKQARVTEPSVEMKPVKAMPPIEKPLSQKKTLFYTPPKMGQQLTLTQIIEMLHLALKDPHHDVNLTAQRVRVMLVEDEDNSKQKEYAMLSIIEKIIFLKEVPFFEGMTVDQLKVLANVCEEKFFTEDSRLYNQGDPGGVLYVVVNGRVAIEQEGKRKGSFKRLQTIDPHSYCGEMNLFDNSPYDSSAVAIQDTLTLRLRREPLIILIRQNPSLSLELINVLSQRLREANQRVAGLTQTRPRELHKLFDQFE